MLACASNGEDEWFESEVRPRLAGNSALVRFADAVMAFALSQARVHGPNQDVAQVYQRARSTAYYE
jgi:hypothetical protein